MTGVANTTSPIKAVCMMSIFCNTDFRNTKNFYYGLQLTGNCNLHFFAIIEHSISNFANVHHYIAITFFKVSQQPLPLYH